MTDDLRHSPLGTAFAEVPFLRELPFLAMVDLRTTEPTPALPGPNRVGRIGPWAVLWLGPDEWLVVGEPGAAPAIETRLRQELGAAVASVVDVSASRTTIEVTGPAARDLLAKGTSVDLHPRVFGPGRCVSTLLARATVILRQVDDGPTYHVLVRGSFAPYLADWLVDAAEEHRAVR